MRPDQLRAPGSVVACHSRPSNCDSTGPRKYSCDCGGAALPGPSNRTRRATLSSSASCAMLPTCMLPERPLRALRVSPGMPHSGAMRGNSTNSASMMGAPSSAMVPAVRSDCASGGRPTGMCALTSAVSSPSSAISMATAVGSDCEKKKLLSMVKKPRKKITRASRRARASSVFRASSTTTSATPASRPRMVRWVTSVAPTASASRASSTQRWGRGRAVQASQPRHSSRPAASALVHSGRWPACGAITQAITASRNSVSRASRGRLARVWRRLMAGGAGGGRQRWRRGGAGEGVAGSMRPAICYSINSCLRLYDRG